ncbi:hypothetical protein E4T56_gene7354 [Termitomyces sp. T112]|nr:hypothetical protein E4T56_gene7354 [Termitomyces sp. T112]
MPSSTLQRRLRRNKKGGLPERGVSMLPQQEFERDTQEILEHLKEKRQSDLVTAEEERGKSWKHKNECRYQSRSKREKGSRTDAMKPIAQITDESALGQALKRISKLNDSDPSDSSSDSSWDDCSSDADTSDSSDSNSSSSDRTSSSSSDNASRGGGQKKKVDRHKLRKSSRKSNRSRKNRKSKNPEAAIVSSLPFHHPMTEPPWICEQETSGSSHFAVPERQSMEVLLTGGILRP